jgi:hypothetical protein
MLKSWSCLLRYSMVECNLAGSGIARALIFAVTSIQFADCPTTQTETHGQFIPGKKARVLLPLVIQGVRWILQSAFSCGRRLATSRQLWGQT